MPQPHAPRIRQAIEQVLRQSGVRRLRHVDKDILLVLAEGLQQHGLAARACWRSCCLSLGEMRSPEKVPALLLNGEPMDLYGGRGWDEIVKNHTLNRKTGRRSFYGTQQWRVHWQDALEPCPPGVALLALRARLLPLLHQTLSQAVAEEISQGSAPARAASRRPRI